MELSYDWRNFQGIFYPHRRSSAGQAQASSTPIYVVCDGDEIVSVFAEREDLSAWLGGSVAELKDRFKYREVLPLERESVNQWIQESLALPHTYEQVEYLRKSVRSNPSKKEIQPLVPKHFLLAGIQGWWGKVLPSSYGVFIRVEGQEDQDFILIVRRGTFAGFHEPDLSGLAIDRKRNPAEIVKYLSERYWIPVQGLFVSSAEWSDWSRHPHPWKEMAKSMRSNRLKLVPFRWSVATLIATRAFLGF